MDADEYLDWYNKENGLFGDNYFLESENNPDNERTLKEVDFLLSQTGINEGGTILDLGCGNGRHSIELAKRGFKVIGVDNNPIFLKEAKGLADKEHVEVEWVQADMRNISLSSKFDLVISLFTSFGYFQIDDDDISVINGVARLLKQGGVFFLDIANKEKIIRMFREKDWRKLSNGSTVIIERWFDFEQGREFEKRTIVSEGSKVRKIYCSFRRYTLVEIVKMCKVAGLDYKRSFGDFNGENLGVNSKRCIVISRC